MSLEVLLDLEEWLSSIVFILPKAIDILER
jgi:hypothetical protein